MEELDAQINNILSARKILKTKLMDLARFEGLSVPTTNQEQAFIEKVLSIIEENIDKNELDVQYMADKLNISRSNLHTKIKSLMNMNTSEFINTVRINRAKELMTDSKYTLSEIAYKVGYNDAAYFTRIFKKTTGKTPGEFRKSGDNS
jgi:YesN/AraC family two-component response regulator